MREIRITIENEEFERLEKLKGDENEGWRTFILSLLEERELLTKAALTVVEGDLLVRGNIINDKDGE